MVKPTSPQERKIESLTDERVLACILRKYGTPEDLKASGLEAPTPEELGNKQLNAKIGIYLGGYETATGGKSPKTDYLKNHGLGSKATHNTISLISKVCLKAQGDILIKNSQEKNNSDNPKALQLEKAQKKLKEFNKPATP